MAKAKVLNVEGKVRKSTIKFAQALLDAGVNVRRVDSNTWSGKPIEVLTLRGKKRFDVRVYLDYRLKEVYALVYTFRGPQMETKIDSHDEFYALLSTWNIAKY